MNTAYDIAYDDVLKRLKEERIRLKLTQREISSCARMGQANYNKVEAGLRRMSYYEVKSLCDTGINVHYVFTGISCDESVRENLSEYSYTELLSLLNLFTSVTELRGRSSETDRWCRLLWHAELFRIVGSGRSEPNVFLTLRRTLGYSQRRMAEKLGVDVKKLRELENGRCLPDSELMCRLYTAFGVSPALVLKEGKCLAGEVGSLLKNFDFEAADSVFGIVKNLQKLPEAL